MIIGGCGNDDTAIGTSVYVTRMKLAAVLRAQIVGLRSKRKKGKQRGVKSPRRVLAASVRREIFAKTSGCCHICGGRIGDDKWQANHVIPYSAGGVHQLDNYLPAHTSCNNYRWDYRSEEFQLIIRLGVWARTQIEHDTGVGNAMAMVFAAHDDRRLKRRKAATSTRI